MFMLQETVHQKQRVSLIRRGFYYIKTTRAVWSRVQVVEHSRRYVRIFYVVIRRQGKWKTQRIRRVEKLPICSIVEARRYNT